MEGSQQAPLGVGEDLGAYPDRWDGPPTFPKLRLAMGVVGGLTLAAFIYHSLTASSRYRAQQEQRAREDRYVGFLHREEANRRLVGGDVTGALKHYSKAARLALCGTEADYRDGAGVADPALCPPAPDAPGAEGWALSLLQRAAAHWIAGDAHSCARDCLAVLRALPRSSPTPLLDGQDGENQPSGAATPLAAEGAGVGVTTEVHLETGGDKNTEKAKEKPKEEEEAERALEKEVRQRGEREERMRARAAELLGRALAASGQPLAALLALHRCVQARSQRSAAAFVQFQHLRDSLQSILLATTAAAATGQTSESVSAEEQQGSLWPIRVATEDGDGTQGVLVATEAVAEGGELLVEKPFLAAPWPAHQTVTACGVYCAHCLRRLLPPDVSPRAPTGPAAAYCSPICEAAAWLLHEHALSSLVTAPPQLARHLAQVDPVTDGHSTEGERRCFLLLAKRAAACLAYGEGETTLKPLWSTIAPTVRSLLALEESPEGERHEEIELQSLVAQLGTLKVTEDQDTTTNNETGTPQGYRGLALFLLGSRVGRSPQPNVQIVFSEPDATLRLVAIRPIAANEPLAAAP